MAQIGNSAENIQGNVQREQTMDEILASIRKIIQSHDEDVPGVDANSHEPIRSEPAANVASLNVEKSHSNQGNSASFETSELQAFRKAMATGALDPVVKPKLESVKPAAVEQKIESPTQDWAPFEEPAAEKTAMETFSEDKLVEASSANVPQRIVSQEPEKKIAAAFDELSAIMMQGKEKQLEQTTETMLRPMLQEWLDEHLPSVVERLVREEIERIARGNI